MMFMRAYSSILSANLVNLDLKEFAYFLGTGGLIQARERSSILLRESRIAGVFGLICEYYYQL